MSASPEISRANGRKGGRPKGLNAINAERGKALLIEMYLENIRPINQALIDKAKAGDIAAIKELHDRVYNKALQPVQGDFNGNINITFGNSFKKNESSY